MATWWNADRSIGITLIACTLASAASLPVLAAPVVEFRIRAHYLAAPATVRMTIVVEPDAANRILHVDIDGEDMYGSTEVTLDGDSAKRFHDVEFKHVPAGHYILQARVLSASAERGAANAEVEVTP